MSVEIPLVAFLASVVGAAGLGLGIASHDYVTVFFSGIVLLCGCAVFMFVMMEL